MLYLKKTSKSGLLVTCLLVPQSYFWDCLKSGFDSRKNPKMEATMMLCIANHLEEKRAQT